VRVTSARRLRTPTASAALRYVHARASTFLMCTVLDVKYPRQPVRACAAYHARDAGR